MRRGLILVLWVVLLLFVQFSGDVPEVQAAFDGTTFSLGKPGFTDVIPHQLVRASNDRLYIFVATAQYDNSVSAYWTSAPGLPNDAAAFDGTATFNEPTEPISVDAVYDGGSIVHVLVNNRINSLKDHPFDVSTNSFKSAITLASGTGSVSGDYIGTSGVSGAVDLNGVLHVVYWSSGNHIIHTGYTYNSGTNALTTVSSPTQVDTTGPANHPSVAVSRVDNSLTVAWVSQATNPRKILARTRSSAGTWGTVETVSTAKVWYSTSAGINIDQGPGLVIDSAGTKHLTYIEDYDATGHYGHVHYVTKTTGAWTDTATPLYSHDPAVAINSGGEVYIIGHGPESTGLNKNMYLMKKNGASWGPLELVKTPSAGAGNSLDASVSVRWSAVGFNRPDTIEFLYFEANGGQYSDTTLYYGRLPSTGTAPTVNIPPLNYFTTSTPTLTWSAVTGATKYDVEVYTSPTLQFLVFAATMLPSTQLFVTVNNPSLSEGVYYWRVRARSASGVPGPWSAVQSFTVDL